MGNNLSVGEYSHLHDTSKLAQYVCNLLLEIKKSSEAESYKNILGTPNTVVPALYKITHR